MTKKQEKTLINLLNERFEIACIADSNLGNEKGTSFLPNNPDYIYYKAIVDTTEWLGYWVERDNKGHHTIYKK